MNEYSELEYKYKADSVSLTDFIKLMEELKPIDRLDISSWDTYYTNSEDSFVRFRQSDTPELTKKVKTKEVNNWQRIEVDLKLDQCIKESTVAKFLELDGYKENFKVYKSCFIFWLDNINYVYYIVYDKELKELGRFIEVEVNKHRVVGLNEKLPNGAVWELNQAASKLDSIGLSPQNRMKKSLFELYKK